MALPPSVAVVVDRCRAALADRVAGRVLDLGTPEGRAVLLAEVASGAPSAADATPAAPAGATLTSGRYDTITSVCGLVHVPDLLAAAAAIDRLLAPAGRLLVVEPVDRPAVGGLVLASLGALHPAARGLHLNRDLPQVLRCTSLTIVDIERIAMPTPIWPLRAFVALTAARVPTPEPVEGHTAAEGEA
jgi:hypothetical protein